MVKIIQILTFLLVRVIEVLSFLLEASVKVFPLWKALGVQFLSRHQLTL